MFDEIMEKTIFISPWNTTIKKMIAIIVFVRNYRQKLRGGKKASKKQSNTKTRPPVNSRPY